MAVCEDGPDFAGAGEPRGRLSEMIDDPGEYFFKLSSIHDAALLEICWNARNKTLRLEFDNFHAAISENDDDPQTSASGEFAGVSDMEGATNGANMTFRDVDTVSALEVVQGSGGWRAKLQMNSGAILCWRFLTLLVTERST